MTKQILNVIKHRLFKIASTIVVVMILGWGISSFAEDDIKSATLNFSVMGIVSEVSEKDLKLIDAKGSNNSGITSYDLNINYLEKIETNKKDSIVLSDIKAGDRVIAQGLTNGSTFFIKRIISFSSIAIEQEKQNATSTEVVADTATTTNAVATDFSSSTNSGTSENATENDKSKDNKVLDVSTSDSSSTTTDEVSTTTENSTTTISVVETVVDVVEAVVDTIKDVIENVLDTFTGDNSTSTESNSDTGVNTENTNSSNQNITENSPEQVSDNSSDVNIITE